MGPGLRALVDFVVYGNMPLEDTLNLKIHADLVGYVADAHTLTGAGSRGEKSDKEEANADLETVC